MLARYLLRFDDLCPGMNWKVWSKIEDILLDEEIRPLLAVVPDNQDEALNVSLPNPCFWDRVRRWQSLGWTIGIHGYQHRFVTANPGILGLNKYSEFAGLSRPEQDAKLTAALAIFRREAVQPAIWIAPAHSFDHITLELLKAKDLRNISDGFYLRPNVDCLGLTWFPQQLWNFRRRPFGVWTICLHANSWTDEDISRFRADVRYYRSSITSFELLRDQYAGRQRTVGDTASARAYLLIGSSLYKIRERVRNRTQQSSRTAEPTALTSPRNR
jgi:predicted deacetylase